MAAITAAVVGGAAAVGGAVISSRASDRASDAQVESADAATQIQHEQYLQSRADLAPARQQGNYAFQQMSHLLGLPTYDANDQTFESGPQAQQQQQPAYSGFPYGGFTAGGLEPGFNFSLLAGGGEQPISQPVEETGDSVGRLDLDPNDPYRGFRESPNYRFNLDEGLRGVSAAASAGGFRGSGRALQESAQYASGLASNEYNNYFNQLAAVAGTGQAATTSTAQLGSNFATQAGNNAIRAGDARASGLVAQGNAINQGINGVAGAVGTYLGGT